MKNKNIKISALISKIDLLLTDYKDSFTEKEISQLREAREILQGHSGLDFEKILEDAEVFARFLQVTEVLVKLFSVHF